MILKKIISYKKIALAKRKKIVSLKRLKTLVNGLAPPRPLAPALRHPGRVTVIAEIKKASPSKGVLCHNFDPVKIAQEYEIAGADAISVLTEENFFLGHPSYLKIAKQSTDLPLLRKDFIIDPYQIYESRALSADAVLLIAAVLPGRQLAELKNLAGELGMSCLVEVHTEPELARAVSAGAQIIGINNRDLNTFRTDLSRTFNLSKRINNQKITVVSESGIKSRTDILRLKDCGVHAALVGEALVCHTDPGEALRELTGHHINMCRANV